MKIVHMTDPHFVPSGDELYGLDPAARFAACLQDIVANHCDAALVVVTGDLADRGECGAYQRLREVLGDFPLPYRLLLGNHDQRGHFRMIFPEVPVDDNGFVQSVLDTPSGRFIFVDTLDEGRSVGVVCEDRLVWLETRLAEAAGIDVYVFMHHPPRRVGVRHFESMLLADPDRFMSCVKGHGRVKHIFFGHVHLPISGIVDGIPFSAARGTCHDIVLKMDQKDVDFVAREPSYDVVLVESNQTTIHTVNLVDHLPAIARSQG